jgi:hypothetical protein
MSLPVSKSHHSEYGVFSRQANRISPAPVTTPGFTLFTGECMKKLQTVVFTMLLAGSLAFAQTGGDKSPAPKGKTDNPTESSKKETKSGKKGHKGGKKGKKGSGGTTSGSTTPK